MTNAIRDYEYLTRLTPITGSQARRGRLDLKRVFGDYSYQFIDEGSGYRRFADPSLLPTDNLREILKRHLPRSVTYTKYDIRNRTDEYFGNDPPEQTSEVLGGVSWGRNVGCADADHAVARGYCCKEFSDSKYFSFGVFWGIVCFLQGE
ncbi:hypothetical protein ACHAPA_008266 [Fusarium lateritium]